MLFVYILALTGLLSILLGLAGQVPSLPESSIQWGLPDLTDQLPAPPRPYTGRLWHPEPFMVEETTILDHRYNLALVEGQAMTRIKAMHKIGQDSVITVEENKGIETELKTTSAPKVVVTKGRARRNKR